MQRAFVTIAIVALITMSWLAGAIQAAPQQEVKDAKYYNEVGLEFFKKGQYDPAIANFTLALKLDPKDVIAYHNRGLLV